MRNLVFNFAVFLMASGVQPAIAFDSTSPGETNASSVAASFLHLGPADIIEPPQSHVAAIGTTTSFTVVADGGLNVHYQWSFNGTRLVGATDATLVLSNVRPANGGKYTIAVSNEFPAVKRDAILRVMTPAHITRPPQSLVVNSNATVKFTVAATGRALHYQWRFQGDDLPHATNAWLTLKNVSGTNEGTYMVVVTNEVSSVDASADLVVHQSPFDLNTNGLTDLLLRNQTNGAWQAWLMNEVRVAKMVQIGSPIDPGLRLVGLNDFDGDGQKDLVLQSSLGAVCIVPVHGTNFLAPYVIDQGTMVVNSWPPIVFSPTKNFSYSPPPPPTQPSVSYVDVGYVTQNWKIVAVADFNSDGQADLLAQNVNGTVAVWFLNGTNFLSGTPTVLSGTNSASTWRIVGTGDFNGDGQADILWQDDLGYLSTWFLNGTNYLGGASLLGGESIGSAWKVVALADFNFDGKTDLVLESNKGVMAIQLLNGTELIGTKLLRDGAAINPKWQVVGPQ